MFINMLSGLRAPLGSTHGTPQHGLQTHASSRNLHYTIWRVLLYRDLRHAQRSARVDVATLHNLSTLHFNEQHSVKPATADELHSSNVAASKVSEEAAVTHADAFTSALLDLLSSSSTSAAAMPQRHSPPFNRRVKQRHWHHAAQAEGDDQQPHTAALLQLLDEHRPDPQQLSRVVTLLTKRGMLHPLQHLCKWSLRQSPPLQPQDCVLATQVITALSARGSGCRQAVQVYKDMRGAGLQPDLVCYNAVLSAAGRCGDLELVRNVWREVQRRKDITPDVVTYTACISAWGEAGEWEKAQKVFQQMDGKGVSPNLITYTSLMRILQRNGQHNAALQLFQKMEAASELQLDAVAYNTAIAAASKAKKWEQAWAVFTSMRHAGVSPTLVSYNTLISACERCGEADRAMEAFEQLQKHAARSSSKTASLQLQPNLVTYNTIMSACGKAGRWHRVELLLDELLLLGFQPDAFTLSAVMIACEKAGKGSEAPALWKRLVEEHGVQANSVAYNALMNAVGSAGNWQQALALLQRMQSDSSYKVDVVSYGCVIAACQRGGQWALALALFDEMQEAGIRPNGYIFASLINACEQGEQWSKAIELFKMMQECSVPQQSMFMLVRRLAYSWPPLFSMLPSPLVKAAIATVKTGQAARRWVEQATADKEEQ